MTYLSPDLVRYSNRFPYRFTSSIHLYPVQILSSIHILWILTKAGCGKISIPDQLDVLAFGCFSTEVCFYKQTLKGENVGTEEMVHGDVTERGNRSETLCTADANSNSCSCRRLSLHLMLCRTHQLHITCSSSWKHNGTMHIYSTNTTYTLHSCTLLRYNTIQLHERFNSLDWLTSYEYQSSAKGIITIAREERERERERRKEEKRVSIAVVFVLCFVCRTRVCTQSSWMTTAAVYRGCCIHTSSPRLLSGPK